MEKKREFVICVSSDDTDLVTPRKLYEVLPDEEGAKVNHIRIIDNEGEDYLYPADQFVQIELSPEIEQALLHAA